MSIRRVVCGMSGGVDSAVSAMLLKKKGYDVLGVFMKNWDIANEKGICTSDQDREDAAYACTKLDIPFHEVNFVKEYWNEVFSKMIQAYEEGATPNPDVLCNRHIKFGHFFRHATEILGADAVATGHYARNSLGDFLEHSTEQRNGAKLLKPVDSVKDQTLFLCQIHQRALRRTMFPLGGLYKRQVYDMARDAGMERIVKRKESMGICFIGTRNFHRFIEEYIEPRSGNFIDIETGNVVGTHKGTHYWTLGQRANIGGMAKAYFIAEIDSSTQEIFVASGTDHPALFANTLTLSPPHWIHKPPTADADGSIDFDFRFQHLHPVLRSVAQQHEDGTLGVKLGRPLRAITRGQYGVLYQGSVCLGAGRILTPGPSLFTLKRQEPVQLQQEFR